MFFTAHAMEEAERVADGYTVIDHGRIVAEEHRRLAEQQRTAPTATLEEAFIARSSAATSARTKPPRPTGGTLRRALAGPLMRPSHLRGAVWILWLRQLKRYSTPARA